LARHGLKLTQQLSICGLAVPVDVDSGNQSRSPLLNPHADFEGITFHGDLEFGDLCAVVASLAIQALNAAKITQQLVGLQVTTDVKEGKNAGAHHRFEFLGRDLQVAVEFQVPNLKLGSFDNDKLQSSVQIIALGLGASHRGKRVSAGFVEFLDGTFGATNLLGIDIT